MFKFSKGYGSRKEISVLRLFQIYYFNSLIESYRGWENIIRTHDSNTTQNHPPEKIISIDICVCECMYRIENRSVVNHRSIVFFLILNKTKSIRCTCIYFT